MFARIFFAVRPSKSSSVRLRFENLEERATPAGVSAGLLGFQDLVSIPSSPTNAPAYLHPDNARPLHVNIGELQATLAAAPSESAVKVGAAPVIMALPAPDGSVQHFAVLLSPVMAPELAAQFPEIQTYMGSGLDDPTAHLRMDITPQGFHAQVLSPRGSWYIDPYYHLETDYAISYYRHDLGRDDVYFVSGNNERPANDTNRDNPIQKRDGQPGCTCPACALYYASAARGDSAERNDSQEGAGGDAPTRTGTQLRTYRLAVAATGEYTAFHGGTVALGQAAIVTAVNRVVGVYETELTVRMTLVANNSSLVYTNAATDPYTNTNGGTMLGQNQTTVDGIIGTGNYDIGHVFSTGGGGVAYLASVGNDSIKAGGVTGSGAPIGDAFWIDYVAHEMGHQFGAPHSFNTSTDSNRSAATAYEPGSGSTIMGYAGITGSDSDTQSYSDPYFNAGSFDRILTHIDSTIAGVGTRTNTGNTVPTVNAGADYVIPAQTPFVLTATGSDPDAGDVLTYSWEEMDLGAANVLSSADNGTSPLFRVYNPTTDPSRTFPRLTDLINNVNTMPLGEKVPTVNRTAMKFRVTARDNRANGGAINTDDMQVRVVNTGTAFAVTSPNTAVTWLVGEQRTVTWNVAGTTASPINTANVNITLSTDGGLTYPITLASNVANNGSATIVVPNNVTSTARVRVQGAGNIFFDISNVNFTIASSTPPTNISGKLFEDWNGNGTFDSFDKGLAGQTILFDKDNDGVQDTQTFTSTGGSVSIPDANPAGATKTLSVSGLPTKLEDVNVRVTITHTWGSDLRVYVTSPSGVKIPLILNRGSGSSSYNNTILDDEAATPIASGSGTFTGTFKPDAFLGMFDGSNPNGTWTLQAVDITYGDTGSITSWALTFPTELTAITDANGDYSVAGLSAGAYQVRPLLTGYNFVAPASGSTTVNLATASSSVPNTNFAVGQQNTIYGLVIADADSNGVFDAGEPGLAGVQVYRDNNNNGAPNGGEPTTTTDALGRYQFTAQPTGAAIIRDVLTGSQVQTFPVGGVYNLNLPANGTLYNNNFGISVGNPPTITSNGGGPTATINVDSGFTAVTTVTATDPDAGTTFTFSIVGGVDAGKFTINPTTGVLTFIVPPNYSSPTDSNGDNSYLVTVQVSDGFLIDQQALTVVVQPDANDAPILDNSGAPSLTPIPQGIAAPSGDTVANIVGATITDADLNPLKGIAVIGLSGTPNGIWQFSLDGGTNWTTFSAVSFTAALNLRDTDQVRFIPNVGFVGFASLTYHAWDRTTGTAGATSDLTGATGGTNAYSLVADTATARIAMTLTPTAEDSTKHRGDQTKLLLSTFVLDNDAKAKKGIAVTGWTTGGGVWQYSPNGLAWKTMPTLSTASALLLRDIDRVRYLPSTDETGYAMLSYHAWDQTTGKRGTLVDLTGPGAMGGSASVGLTSDVAFAQTTSLNDRPVLDNGGLTYLTTVAPNDLNPAGDTIAGLLKSRVTDSDPGAVKGIAITGVGKTTNGLWQYSTDAGANWATFPAVTVKTALLLRAQDKVRFVPNAGFTGTVTFTFKAWDQTEGTFGTATNSTIQQGTLAYSTLSETATLIVGTPPVVNNAPVLNTVPNPALTNVDEDKKSAGNLVSDLLLLGSSVTDSDFNALKGIAVTGVTGTTTGRWEWSPNGAVWKPILPVSESRALLLRITDRIRYVPNANSTAGATVTFRAWDQTQGTAGGRADLTIAGATGGATPFSVASDTATVAVNPINDAPVLNTATNPVLPPPESANPAGVLVSSFLTNLVTDVDAGALQGIAVTKSMAAFGNWEYSTDNGATWTIFPTFPPLTETSALLLSSTAKVRVNPFVGVGGTATFTFKAWDQSVGTVGALTNSKQTTAFSKLSETVTMGYNNGNNKPLLNIAPNPVIAHPTGSTVATLLGTSVTDPDVGALQGIAVTFATTTAKTGTWKFSLDGGVSWAAMGAVSANNALLLRPTDMVRFEPVPGYLGVQRLMYKAWDQTTGSAGGRSKTNFAAFSTATETAIVNVNTAPELVL